MDSAIKAHLELGGQPLLLRALDRLGPQCGPLAVCAGPHSARMPPLLSDAWAKVSVLDDALPGHAGPLAGLLAALEWAAEAGLDDVLVVPVDTPFFPIDLGERLRAKRGMADAAIAADASGEQPALGLWRSPLASALRRALEQGVRKLGDFARASGAVSVTFAEREAFLNINRPEDLARADAMLKRT